MSAADMPRKLGATVQVDRQLLDAPSWPDPWLALDRLAQRQRAANQAAVARKLVQSLAEGAHRGVLVILNDDGTVTASVDGRVPGKTVTELRRHDLGAWESRGCAT